MDQFGPPDDHFRGQNAIFETIWSLKTDNFAHEKALWGQAMTSTRYSTLLGIFFHYSYPTRKFYYSAE